MLNCNRHLLATFREQVQSVQLTSLHFKTTIFESERVDFNASKCFFPEKYPLPILYRCYAGTPLPMYDRTENYTTLSYGNIVKKGNGPICLILFSVYLSITNFLCCCVGVNWNGGSDSEIQKIHVAIFITIWYQAWLLHWSLTFLWFDGILHNCFALNSVLHLASI